MNEPQIPFEDMTNAQLKELVEDFGLTVEAANPAKPNKTELLESLNAFKAKQDAIHNPVVEEKVDAEVVEEPAVTGRGIKAPTTDVKKVSSKQELMRADLFRKERVIINDNQTAQTKEEMVSVSWGNRMIGGQTDFVPMHGEPQYVRRGALANLREANMVEHVQKERGGVEMVKRKRFSIVPVEGLTEAEITALAAKQAMRNASYA